MKPLAFFILVLLTLVGCASTPELPINPPRLMEAPHVVYPAASRRLEEEGKVFLRVQILASGQIGEQIVQKSSGHAKLDAAALKAVNALKATPATTQSGQPVDSFIVIPFDFRLAP